MLRGCEAELGCSSDAAVSGRRGKTQHRMYRHPLWLLFPVKQVREVINAHLHQRLLVVEGLDDPALPRQ